MISLSLSLVVIYYYLENFLIINIISIVWWRVSVGGHQTEPLLIIAYIFITTNKLYGIILSPHLDINRWNCRHLGEVLAMVSKFQPQLDFQPIRLVFQSADLSNWNLSYYLPILICHFIIYLSLLGRLSFLSSLSVHLRHSKGRMKSRQKEKFSNLDSQMILDWLEITHSRYRWFSYSELFYFWSPLSPTIDAQC